VAKFSHSSGKEETVMSRIGIKPITVPAGVDVNIADGNVVSVKGPKGTITKTFHADMVIKQEGTEIVVSRPTENKIHKSLHGLTRTLIANMVEGVTNGFKKELDVNGVGFRVQKQGKDLIMNLGFSHQVIVSDTEDVTIESPAPNKIIVSGIDKQKVGQFAAEIRSKRRPEPYKGKGIKYVDEVIRRKEGKAGKGKK
jgi:large subunit ribosomal protein L6